MTGRIADHTVAAALGAVILALLQSMWAVPSRAQEAGGNAPPQNQNRGDAADAPSRQPGNSPAANTAGGNADRDSGAQGEPTGRGASGLHSTGTTGRSEAGAQGKHTYSQPDARANLRPSAAMVHGVAQAGEQLAVKGATDKGVVACNACHGELGQGNSVSGFPRLAGFPEAYLRKQLHDYASGARAHPIMTPIAAGLTPEQRRNVAAYYASRQIEGTNAVAWRSANTGSNTRQSDGEPYDNEQSNNEPSNNGRSDSNNPQSDNRLDPAHPAAVASSNREAPGGTAAATIAPAGASQENDKAVHSAPVMPANPARARLLASSGDERLHAQACANCHGPDGIGLSPAYPPLAGQHASYLTVAMNEWRDGTRHNDPSQQMPMIAKSLSDSDIAALAALFAGMPPAVGR